MTLASETVDSIDSKRFLCSRLAVAAICVALADWLFYDRAIGLSFAIFLVVLALAVVLSNALSTAPVRIGAALAIFVAGLRRRLNVWAFSPQLSARWASCSSRC